MSGPLAIADAWSGAASCAVITDVNRDHVDRPLDRAAHSGKAEEKVDDWLDLLLSSLLLSYSRTLLLPYSLALLLSYSPCLSLSLSLRPQPLEGGEGQVLFKTLCVHRVFNSMTLTR